MTRFTKGIVQKILIILTIILLIEYMVPSNRSMADSDAWEKVGGVLLEPAARFACAIGDVGMEMANYLLYHKSAFYKLELHSWLESDFDYEIKIPIFKVSPEKIFSNEIAILDINFFNPTEFGEEESSAAILSPTISTWYVTLRNIALVAMLSVLAYTGLRIMLASIASEKAKYKQMLMDWLIGILLLFFMHYIMSFSVTIVNQITKMLSNSNITTEVSYDLTEYWETSERWKPFWDFLHGEAETEETKETLEEIRQIVSEQKGEEVQLEDLKSFSLDLGITALMRYKASEYLGESGTHEQTGDGRDVIQAVFYIVIYLVLVIYTYMFLFQYLKRLIKMAFLTIIAPLIALSYPLDKLKDGKAQAFNMWLKEYIFNLILQPLHLVLYIILMGTVTDLVTNNPIYAIVALGFLLQAEKLVRSLFGVKGAVGDKDGSFVGGAMVMSGLNAVVNSIKGKDHKGGKSIGEGQEGEAKVRMAQRSADNPDAQTDFIMSGLGESVTSKMERLEKEKKESENRINEYNRLGMQDKADAETNNFKKITEELAQLQKPTGAPTQNSQSAEAKAASSASQTAAVINSMNKMAKVNSTGSSSNKPKKAIKGAAVLKTGLKFAGKGLRVGGGKLAKGYLTATGAATLGMIGIAAGLASDKYENVATWGAAAATGGAMVGKMAGDKVENVIVNTGDVAESIRQKANAIRDEFNKSVYEDDPAGLKAYRNKRADEEFMHSKTAQQKYREKFGKGKYMEAMEKALRYREHGITDDDVIISAMRLKGHNVSDDLGDDTRIRAAMLAMQVKQRDSKGVETLEKRLRAKGKDEEDIQEYLDMVREIRDVL